MIGHLEIRMVGDAHPDMVVSCQEQNSLRTQHFLMPGSLLPDVFQGTRRGGTVFTTVDHSDIRGLVTDMTFLRRGAASGLPAGVRPGGLIPLGWARILLSVVAPLRLPWTYYLSSAWLTPFISHCSGLVFDPCLRYTYF